MSPSCCSTIWCADRGAIPKGFNFPTTAEFDAVAAMPTFVEGSRLHLGRVIALLVVVGGDDPAGAHAEGLRDPLVGAAPRAARFAGFDDRTADVRDVR